MPENVKATTVPGGVNGPFPAELQGWNWGGFFLAFFWGIAHNAWVGILSILWVIPVVGWAISLFVSIYLGAKGNELAWQHRKFESVEQFKAVQAAWAKWCIYYLLLMVALFIGSWVLFIAYVTTHPNSFIL